MTEEYSPGSREIVAAIIESWKQDPSTESSSSAKLSTRLKEKKADKNWVLSEKRMKAALKEFNLQPNQPKFTFVKETVSEIVPNSPMPAGVQIQMSKGRGKALYATKNFREGDKLWDEEPLVQAGPVEMLRLMRGGKACAYCAKLLRTTPDGKPLPRSGVACINCTANWCSNHCKRDDIGHADTHHDRAVRTNSKKPVISTPKWKSYEQFCLDQNWNAGYLYAVTLLHKIRSSKTISGIDSTPYANVMKGLARVRQDIRQRAVSEPNSLEFEHHEQMWQRGHRMLAEAVKQLYDSSYEEYSEGIGMVNINNIRGCIFQTHANSNHNCEPNVKVEFNSDSKAQGITVYARKDIDAGQELTTSYVDIAWGVDQRQSELRINWGFNCGCARCKRERQAKIDPIAKPVKPALKPSPPLSPFDGTPIDFPKSEKPSDGAADSATSPVSRTRTRTKSVHFDKNPVSLEVSS